MLNFDFYDPIVASRSGRDGYCRATELAVMQHFYL